MIRVAAAGLSLIALTGCLHVFTVAVAPGPAGPTFSLVRSAPLDTRRCVEHLRVHRAGERRPIWSIERRERCPTTTRFVYGVVPPGWMEFVPPAPLEAGGRYEISVSTPGGTGGRTFLADGPAVDPSP